MEVLIHTSAPSGRKDDQKFKRQAEGYESFQTAKRIAIEDKPLADTQHDDHRISVKLHHTVNVDDASAPLTYQAPVFIDDTQLAVSALESQLLTESLKRRISRSTRHLEHDELVEALLEDEDSSAEVVTPSRPPRNESYVVQGNDELPRDQETLHNDANSTPAPRPLDSPYIPVREGAGLGIGYIGTFGNGEPQAPSQTLPVGDHVTATPQDTRRTHSSSWTGDDVPSQLPSSYSLSSENTSKASVPVPFGGQPLQATDTEKRVEEDVPDHALPSAVRQEAPLTANPAAHSTPHARSVTKDQQGAAPSTTLVRRHTPPGPTIPQSTPAVPPSPSTLHTLCSLPLSIHPPAPPTSLDSFKTHVTTALASLLSHPEVSTKYDPRTQTRALLPSERGFWLLDTRPWCAANQVEFWEFLTKFVGHGSAGFGVWATRCNDEVRPPGTSGSGSAVRGDQVRDENKAADGLGTVQVFCWGEVVPHIYLLLYVASKSRIKKVGAQWVDAGGEVIVKMPAR